MKAKTITLISLLVCFAGLVMAQEMNLIFEQKHDPNGSTYLSTLDPEFPVDFEVAENFFNIYQPIEKVAFYGLALINSSFGIEEWIPRDEEPFIVRFYEYFDIPPDDVMEPDWENPFWEQVRFADVEHVGSFFDKLWGMEFRMYRFEIDLKDHIRMAEGWFSAQLYQDYASGLWFYWLGSADGDGISYIRNRITGHKLSNDFAVEFFYEPPSFNLMDLNFYQLSYDWGDTYQQMYSDVGIISYEYQPWVYSTYLNVFLQNPDGEPYWVIQTYLPSEEYAHGKQTISFGFDLQPLGVAPGDTPGDISAFITRSEDPLIDIPELPPPGTWPVITVKQMLDNTLGGFLTDLSTGTGVMVDWPFKPNHNFWNSPITELVFRGNEMPNIDLDNLHHPYSHAATGYAGDNKACTPAAYSNSIKWLESTYKDSVPSLNTNQTHREVLEDLSDKMNRIANRGTYKKNQIAGKMKYAQQHRLPLITKFQADTTYLKKGIDIRPLGTSYAATNQTGNSGKPDWNWLVQELKNGEDVELSYFLWDDSLNRWNGGHTVALAGVLEIDTLLRALWYNHDRDQSKSDTGAVLQEFSFVAELDGWLVLPGLSNRRHTARVTTLVSESYDPTKTYERISGTLTGMDGGVIDPGKLEIEAHPWNNPDDALSMRKGTISYKVINGVAFSDIDYDSFENPPQPGDRIKITFWDGDAFVSQVVHIPDEKGPVFIEVVVENQLISLNFTEWHEIGVPPGKRLSIQFLQPPSPGCNRNADVVVWNGSSWVRPSWGYFNNNQYGAKRSIFNDTNKYGSIRLHHADESNPGTFFFTLSDLKMDASPGNQHEHANVNLGGRDSSHVEFGHIQAVTYHYTYEIGAILVEFPGTIGAGGVQELHFHFESFDNMFWSDMKLTIDLMNVVGEGFLHIERTGKDASITSAYIGPGQEVVTANLGEFMPPGSHSLVITVDPSLQFDVDCFNMSSLIITLNPDDFIHVMGSGIVTLEPDEGPYRFGEPITLTAIPGEGFGFVNWEGVFTLANKDHVFKSEENPLEIIIEKDTHVTATFVVSTYTLSYRAGTGGSLEGDLEQTVEHGADGTLVHAVPNEGHHFTGWSDGIKDNPRTDTNVTANLDVEAKFAVSSFVLGLEVEPPGTGQVSGAGEYDFQMHINLTATPESGHEFVRWADEQNETLSDQAMFVFIMPAYDLTLTAHFLLSTYSVSFMIENNRGETITGAAVTLGQTEHAPGDCVFDDVAPGEYAYTVRAKNYFDASGDVEVIDQDISVRVVMDVDDTSLAEATIPLISIYPNPAHNTLYIESNDEVLHIQLLDIIGQCVISEPVNDFRHEVSVSGLKDGLYFIRVFTHWGVKTQKVQVNR